MSGTKPHIVNPYAKRGPLTTVNTEEMGRQSQQRISNTKRKYQFAGSIGKKAARKGDQKTLFGGVAFDASKVC